MGTQPSLGGSRRLLPRLIVLLLATGVAFSFFAPETGEYWGFGGLMLGLTGAVVLLLRRSVDLPTRERNVWRLVAAALSMYLLGVLAIATLTELGHPVDAYSPIDSFFLIGYVIMIAAIYRMARLDSGGREWVLTIADALVGGVALAALVWSYLFEQLNMIWSGAAGWEVLIASAYPVIDVILVVGLLVMILRRSNYNLDLRLVFFAAGATAQVFGDFLYMNAAIGQTFTPAEPPWPVNIFAVLCLFIMAAIVDRAPRRREYAEAPTPLWAISWPYLLVALLVAVLFQNYRDFDPGSSQVLLLDALIVIGIIIFLRQVYVIYRDRNKVDRKRAELVASVSHELRTPLTAMVGFLTLLDEHPEEFPADARKEMISEATDQARHMSRLVSDLLMLARGDTSYMTLEVKDVTAMSLVTSVLRTTDTGDLRVDEELEPDVIVRVDPDRMRQALGNLITNAARYGGDRCLLVARTKGDDLILELHDNGEGVPPRFENVIWEHFERGAHRLDAVTPGLGIGLSIVQAVVETHGGRVEYRESERLGGACFSLHIPDCVVHEERSVTRRVAEHR